jgi:hypothetical protein
MKPQKTLWPSRQSMWAHSAHTPETLLPEPNNSESGGQRLSSVYPLRQTLADKNCRYIQTRHCMSLSTRPHTVHNAQFLAEY